jgi:hypothetical protein
MPPPLRHLTRRVAPRQGSVSRATRAGASRCRAAALKLAFGLVLALPWLGACATGRAAPDTASAGPEAPAAAPAARLPDPVWLTDARQISILPVAALGGRLETRQLIQGIYKGQSYAMDVVIDADAGHFSLIALNGFGTQIFDLEYDAAGLRYESGLPIGKLKPEYLMADFQLCYFPAGALRGMLEAAGLGFDQEGQGTRWRRTVRDGAAAIIEIERTGSELNYRNLLRGYSYHIQEGS